MRSFKRALGVFIIVCLCISLAACGNAPAPSSPAPVTAPSGSSDPEPAGSTDTVSEGSLIGSWELVSGKTDIAAMTIYSNGTCTVTDVGSGQTENGNWELADDTLRILGPYGGQFWDIDNLIGTCRLSENELSFVKPLIDGSKSSSDVVFKRVDANSPSPADSSDSAPAASLTGSWKLVSGKTDIGAMKIYSNGTCTVTDGGSGQTENGKWELVDDTLKILGPYGGQFWDIDNLIGTYRLSEDELRFIKPIIDGSQSSSDVVFKRVDQNSPSPADSSDSAPAASLTGSWKLVSGKTDIGAMKIYSNGTCTVTDGGSGQTENGKWELVDDTLKILGPYGGQFWDIDNLIGTYRLSENELRFIKPIIDGSQSSSDVVFKRE